LNLPEIPVNIDSLNGQSLVSNVQLKALSHSVIKGQVADGLGNPSENFDGEAVVTVFDAQTKYVIPNFAGNSMLKEGGAIFRGIVTVEEGRFETEFVVPKDISYSNEKGKIVVYVYNDEIDGIGFSQNLLIGGSDSSAVNDNKGPDIGIYFDDINFENSYLVNPDFNLIVDLEDETGLNITGLGIGHKLEAILDNNASNSIDLSNYFTGDLNSGGKSGKIEYNFLDLEPGEHNITVKAWDVFNNATIENARFSVVNNEGLVIQDVYNFPNPFSSNTVFTFQHNYNNYIDVKIKIYTIAGRLVRVIEKTNLLDKFVKIDWDGRDQDGDLVSNGTYLYKLILNSVTDEKSQSIFGKLAVVR
jgi:hypothetical protein